MKIAFISANDPCLPRVDSDGGGVTPRRYALGLAHLGHKITYFTPRIQRGSYQNAYLDRKSRAQKEDFTQVTKNFRVVRKLMRPPEDQYQLDQMARTSFLGRVVESFIFANTFDSNELNRFDVCCFFYPSTSLGFMTMDITSKKFLFPLLLSDEYLKYREVSELYKNLETSVLKKVDLILSPSRAEKQAILRKGITSQKVKILHRGFDPISFPAVIHIPPSQKEEIVIACVGALRPQKNQHMLLDVARILKKKNVQFVFWIIGEDAGIRSASSGAYGRKMKQEVQAQKLEKHFWFTGSVSEAQVGQLLKEADMATFPSLAESYGKAMLESICSGLPTILCDDIPAYAEFAKHGRNSWMAQRNPTAFAEAILRLVRNQKLYAKLSKQGLAMRGKSTWERVSMSLSKILQKLR